MAAIDQEEMDALEELKATNQIITSSFQTDLLMLQSKHKALTTDFEQQKSQLIDALLSKDRLMKDLESFKERLGATGDDTYQKAQAKAIIDQENAQKALQEVSATPDTSNAKSPDKPRRFLKALSRLSFRPYIPQAQAIRLEVVPESDEATLAALELQRERAAIGIGQATPRPLISPRTVPLPLSPAKEQISRTDVKRRRNAKMFNQD